MDSLDDNSDEYEDPDLFNPSVHRMTTPDGVRVCKVSENISFFYNTLALPPPAQCEWHLSPPIGYVPASAWSGEGAVQFFVQWWRAVGWWWVSHAWTTQTNHLHKYGNTHLSCSLVKPTSNHSDRFDFCCQYITDLGNQDLAGFLSAYQ